MATTRAREKSVLSRQDIASRRKQIEKQKMKTGPTGRRAIAGVALLTLSVLALLSVATFDAHDRVGPGFHNAIGPVGHAIAETLRGLLGYTAFVLPFAGLYATGILFGAEKGKRRWPQVICLGLLLVSSAVLCQLMIHPEGLPHAPGGMIGMQAGGLLTALFSTVGTVVLVAALASVALIVGTQFAFLRFIAWASELGIAAGRQLKAVGMALIAYQKKKWAERKARREREALEEAAFLAELEKEEAQLAELEAAAAEADEIAEENARLLREATEDKRKKLFDEKDAKIIEKEAVLKAKQADRDAKMLEAEALRTEREALKAARDAARERERLEKEQAKGPLPLPAPSVAVQPAQPSMPPLPMAGDEPAWAMSLAPRAPSLEARGPTDAMRPRGEVVAQQSNPPPPRRAPNLVLPPGVPPPPPAEAFNSLPPHQLESVDDSMMVAADLAAPGALLAEAGAAVAAPAAAAIVPAVPLAPAVAAALGRTPIIVEPKAPPKPTKKKEQEQFEFVGGRKSFQVPPMDLLEANAHARPVLDKEAFLITADRLCAKLRDFGIEGEVVEIRPGPVVTMYEFKPAPGVKISKIASLSDDLAMAMEAMRVRIVAPIPGKGVVGIEVPNKDRETVFLKEIAEQDAFTKSTSRLTMCLGKDIEGMPYVLDLAKAPHLLIAGTTGSGKSVSVNSMIMSVLLKSTPEEVRFIMVDPKMLELSVYEGIPHLLLPVVTDPRKAALALQWAVDEMTRRYKLLSEAGVRNIAGYNALVETDKKKGVAPAKKAPATVDSTRVVAPVIPSLETPTPVAEPVAEAAAPAPAPSPDTGKKKKRKLFIVDMDAAADGTVTPPPMPAVDPQSPELGVAAPSASENPREDLAAEAPAPELSPPVAAELHATVNEAEIRVDEQTAEEAAALELAAAVSADAEIPAERQKLPYIVVIIDELADLMMVASKEVETSVARLAQMARAAGIHLMVATQRPSTDVVTGVIKANFPTRISFMLRSKPDSMTVLGTVGAEALLGMGDMLILPPTSAHLQRVHGAFVSETEIKKVVDVLKAQGKPVYDENILKPREDEAPGPGEEDELSDELYDEAIRIVSEMKQVSISMLQRKMRIGYNRAARMIERMERDGVVGAADGAKPRDVLISPMSIGSAGAPAP